MEIVQQPTSRCTEFTLNGVDRTFMTNAASLASLATATCRIFNQDLDLTDMVQAELDAESTPKGFTVYISKIGESPSGNHYYELAQRNTGEMSIVVPVKIRVRVYKPNYSTGFSSGND